MASIRDVACQQILLEDSSVFSVQWLVLPFDLADGVTPEFLLERYLNHLRRFTLTLVRPRSEPGGLGLRLVGTRLNLIEFSGPEFHQDDRRHSAVLAIRGGILVQPDRCDRGRLELSTEELDDGLRVELQLSDYCPLLLGSAKPSTMHRMLYRFTQAAIHKVVTVRFLLRLYRELAGPHACVRVVPAQVRKGRPT
ncbi:hypothetical protein SAMN05660860_02267 [Geoalkalibacter ferrihydriticus]|uniref:DUF1997 domain-containing protein n=2 Tax=Geoalkalibacter ferrihydriticus TaxID=392333 RepID=A0A0C2HLQ7_9BACT|nr:hypothetical protein [Geoalkalibacter ferrihydriticus]KIH78051.1 hypothetical protein GFER_05540 [Geoalkalibacter ferrihydriticus DSM 17813]SDM31484.1 hypothetical protein SAMN05660860_02267 [Geoalkalibacter ferrihydriticus]